MKRIRDIVKRSVVLALAVWLTALSASVERLHRHAAGGRAATLYECGFRAVGPADAGATRHSAAVRASLPGGIDEGSGCCPACIFLKSCNQEAVNWVARLPYGTCDEYVPRHGAGPFVSPVVFSRFPRAPPPTLS
jgi:hypothetical protein